MGWGWAGGECVFKNEKCSESHFLILLKLTWLCKQKYDVLHKYNFQKIMLIVYRNTETCCLCFNYSDVLFVWLSVHCRAISQKHSSELFSLLACFRLSFLNSQLPTGLNMELVPRYITELLTPCCFFRLICSSLADQQYCKVKFALLED